MNNVVDESTLNWEWYLASLMFYYYNTSYHRTINTTLFELTYGVKPRLLAFRTSEFKRINYGTGFVAKRL
jgi:hypothetical protein